MSSLGPHNENEEQLSIPVKKFVWGMHQIPSALIMLAMVSFASNFAFGYTSLVRKGLEPEILSANSVPLGSDDETEIFTPPTFAPSTHFKAIAKPASLKVSAESYIVADADTGEILLEKEPDNVFPMASVSKLMTAIVAKEQIDLHHLATVSASSYNTYGAQGELALGEKILVSDLFYPLLIESSNDAAEVLADDYGRDDFLELLNKKAKLLGMDSTHYDDPSGLSPTNVSSAHDLTKLGLYVYQSYPELLDITRVKEYAIFEHTWKNANYYLTNPNFIGGKNGFIDEAKKTTVSFFKVHMRGDDPSSKSTERPIMVVLLRSNDRNTDAATLLSYVGKNIRYVPDAVVE